MGELLQYIADDLPSYAYRLMHTDNADDLALLVTELAHAALLSGADTYPLLGIQTCANPLSHASPTHA